MKLYTCFSFKNIDPDTLHCTHKYLGEQSEEKIELLLAHLKTYFRTPRDFPRARFENEHFFGPDKNIRVLSPKSWQMRGWFYELRDSFISFRNDDYDNYHPHVTTEFESVIDKPFSSYDLIRDKKVIGTWINPKAK